MPLAERIRQLRKEADLSQAELADKIGAVVAAAGDGQEAGHA